jgi:hypothetical protein
VPELRGVLELHARYATEIHGLEDSDRCTIQLKAKGWFKVHAKISVMALTPSPL